jgi:hypothetical protein
MTGGLNVTGQLFVAVDEPWIVVCVAPALVEVVEPPAVVVDVVEADPAVVVDAVDPDPAVVVVVDPVPTVVVVVGSAPIEIEPSPPALTVGSGPVRPARGAGTVTALDGSGSAPPTAEVVTGEATGVGAPRTPPTADGTVSGGSVSGGSERADAGVVPPLPATTKDEASASVAAAPRRGIRWSLTALLRARPRRRTGKTRLPDRYGPNPRFA